MIRLLAVPLAVALLGVVAGCGAGSESELLDPGGLGAIDYIPVPDPDGEDPLDDPAGGAGILVRFGVQGETLSVFVTDEVAIDMLIATHEGPGAFTHFSGLIRPGPGVNQENAPWSWHIDGRWVIVNRPHDPLTSVEGPLQFIEANLENLILRDMHYQITAPDATLEEIVDYR